LATDAAAQGAGPEDLREILESEDLMGLAADALTLATSSWRQWFHSFGTCSIAEPLESLAAMGLSPESFTGVFAATTDFSDFERPNLVIH
jgi:hypothetical protein